jgi:uncharacterized protein GlcG (DUF336 family)
MTKIESIELARAYVALSNAHRTDLILALFAGDAVYRSSAVGEHQGATAIIAMMHAFFTRYPDVCWKCANYRCADRRVSFAFELRATDAGDGSKLQRDGIEHIEFDAHGLIKALEVNAAQGMESKPDRIATEKLPIPSLTLATAQQIIAGSLAGERSSSERHIAVAVCDTGAHPLALAREDLAPPLLAHIAQAKAFTCIAYGKPTDLVRDWAEATPAWFEGVTNVAQATMGMPLIGSRGGVTIVDENGTVLGAVGIAGEAGEFDEALARRGIESAGLCAVCS